jgi:hypothetical protein
LEGSNFERAFRMDEQIPAWAIELIKQVERLNEKIPTHIEWVERNMKDHETRLRNLEQFKWILVGLALTSGAAGAGIVQMMGL